MNAKTKPNEVTSPRRSVLSFFGAKPKPQSLTTATVTQPAPEPALPANARRILVVDDDAVVCQALAMKLKAHGFAVSTAMDGPSAIHAARSGRPDLILLDLSFPPDVSLAWDGFKIMNWLRHLDETKNIPVIIVTGSHEKNLGQRAQAAGAAGVFNKPLDFRPLISLVELRLKSPAGRSRSPANANAKD
jgi:CheY-like chemotaxis protein